MTAASNSFLDLLQPSEFEHGEAAGLGGRGAGANLVGGRHVDERLQLVVQILLGPISMDDPAHDGPQAMQERHAPSRTHGDRERDAVPALAMLFELAPPGSR